MKYFTNSIIFLIIICDIINATKTFNNKTFVPKKHWQTVEDGQTIPSGLHIRINLETGKKEAKLMDDDNNTTTISDEGTINTDDDQQDHNNKHNDPKKDDNVKSLTIVSDELQDKLLLNKSNTTSSTPTVGTKMPTISHQLEEALKNLSKSDDNIKDNNNNNNNNDDNVERVRAKYKTYEEIKKIFDESDMKIESDFEIINKLFKKYENLSKYHERELILTQILEDLNYLSHQIDNALLFIEKGGLNSIILPIMMNQTNRNLRTKSIRILGALTQNNPKVKIHVFEKNFGNYLQQILINSTDTEELSATIYAYGGLLRQFPYAQIDLLQKNGIKIILLLLTKNDINIKIKIKIIKLLNDLLNEYDTIIKNENINSSKYKQYENIKIREWLKNENFCKFYNDFLITIQIDLFSSNIELLDELIILSENTYMICLHLFQQIYLINIIEKFYKNYQDEYIKDIEKRLYDIMNKVQANRYKDEL